MGGRGLARIAAEGQWGKVEWATDANGNLPARSYLLALPPGDQAKVLRLFQLLANKGSIANREKFKKLGKKAKGKGSELREFKSFQHRFLGDYRPNNRFIVAHALRKKRDDLSSIEIQKAVQILQENDQREQKREDKRKESL